MSGWQVRRLAGPGPPPSEVKWEEGEGSKEGRLVGRRDQECALQEPAVHLGLPPGREGEGEEQQGQLGVEGGGEGGQVEPASMGRGGLVAETVSFTTSALPPATGAPEGQPGVELGASRPGQLRQHSALSRQLAPAGGLTSSSISSCARRPAISSMQSLSG